MQRLIEIPSDEKRHDNKVLFIYKHSMLANNLLFCYVVGPELSTRQLNIIDLTVDYKTINCKTINC